MVTIGDAAPELDVVEWFNTDRAPSMASERGKVIVVHAFQMLCPGCVLQGTPLAQRIHNHFAGADLTVIGLHTVFEHHAAMTPVSLAAYLHEFRITMPVAVDRPGDGPIPHTMAAYELRGTPTLILIDRNGRVRHHHFGTVDELTVGASIARLLDEGAH
ncbi:MAG: redoxin domain-containing protein [Acidimicrobiales bacterium]